jgi:predicted kinase
MTWLILIVRLGRAAPRHRRRVFAELHDAGAVALSEGVWAIPDTGSQRSAVEACVRHAAKAGGDIVMLNTSADNSPTQHVLEAALAERLNAEAAVLARKCDDFEAMTAPGTTTDIEPAGRDRAVTELMEEAKGLSRRDVI